MITGARSCHQQLINTPKLRPRTKHPFIQLHHFRQYILKKTITVEKVDTKYQRADIMTKALATTRFISDAWATDYLLVALCEGE